MPDIPDIKTYENAVEWLLSDAPLSTGKRVAASAALLNMLQEVKAFRTLQDPAILHINLLKGIPAKLSQRQLLHLVGAGECSNQGCCLRERREEDALPAG